METGWLIEKHFDGVVHYVSIEFGIIFYTAEHVAALRFARRTDAEKFFDMLLFFDDYYEGAFVREHTWATQ